MISRFFIGGSWPLVITPLMGRNRWTAANKIKEIFSFFLVVDFIWFFCSLHDPRNEPHGGRDPPERGKAPFPNFKKKWPTRARLCIFLKIHFIFRLTSTGTKFLKKGRKKSCGTSRLPSFLFPKWRPSRTENDFFLEFWPPPSSPYKKKPKMTKKWRKICGRAAIDHIERNDADANRSLDDCVLFLFFFLSQKLDKIITSVRDDRHYGSSEVKIHDFIGKKKQKTKKKKKRWGVCFL